MQGGVAATEKKRVRSVDLMNTSQSVGRSARFLTCLILLTLGSASSTCWGQKPDGVAGTMGYYRQPTLRGDTLIFVAEGDIWKASLARAKDGGAVATRLTSHAGEEANPKLSPDGTMVAFTAQYEGPTEVYVMSVAGGRPTRLTYDAARASVVGWSKNLAGDLRVIAGTTRFSTLPNTQLTLIHPETGERQLIPLAQASDGSIGEEGVLFFTRLAFQGSQTKRYKGGTAQQIWRFNLNLPEASRVEAQGLTVDFAGTSYSPVEYEGLIYHLTDRDGTMEVWSMLPDGKDLRQVTDHTDGNAAYLDVRGFAVDSGAIAYQLGADLWAGELKTATMQRLRITLDSDFDQLRERWVKKPMDYVTSSHVSHDGSRVAITARGTVFVAPRTRGRLVELPRLDAATGNIARHRDARFMADGDSVLTISDQTGETEFWTVPGNGVDTPAKARQLTKDSGVLRLEGVPSPDGRWLAHHDKDQRLFVLDIASGIDFKIAENPWDSFTDIAWSADSKWFAFTANASNQNPQVNVYNVNSKRATLVTTDRFASYSAAWSADGKWLYFLSDRQLTSSVASPWGLMAPEPYFDRRTQVYAVSLIAGERWPFVADDELHKLTVEDEKRDLKPEVKPEVKPEIKPDVKPEVKPEVKPDVKPDIKPELDPKPMPEVEPPQTPVTQPAVVPAPSPDAKPPTAIAAGGATSPESAEKKVDPAPIKPVIIDLEGIAARLFQVPLAAGNYSSLTVQPKRLLLLNRPSGETKNQLVTYPIANKDLELKTVIPEVDSYEVSGDGKWLLVRKTGTLHVLDSGAGPNAPLEKTAIDLSGWSFPISPRQEWRQMFIEGWRLERDYFWDSNMHGVDWKGMLQRYLPLADRIATRTELNDLLSQMVGELSALHIFVRGGDIRTGDTDIAPAAWGGALVRDEAAGGYRIETVYLSDPDEPARTSPLAAAGVGLAVGDLILQVNGRDVLSVADLSMLLRNQAGKQVLVRAKRKATGAIGEVIVTPITAAAEEDLRYHQWQFTRRLRVDAESGNDIGYVHLRAMGTENYTEFAKGFYPVYQRKGLILDARNNRGGNIDSWILSRLLRQAWFYWSPDVGSSYWNMQFAFRGHIVVLCNERTASDGEALAEGIRRLKLGTIIGTRTWGGKIWLSANNFLVDNGIATAAETGVFGPEGEWLIEGHGVDPDIVVDNLPHATFNGADAQLDAAIAYLQKKIAEQPVEVPAAPKRPDKSWRPK